ncbi:MAG: hypothetical protein UW46_C0012G0014 [Candidatus Yanofskybacteria bacterium GW2011_GWF1_44_227]|uniref:Uncharacterized protein n=1 Tax=Candidatus Yanofskybacteria bacterium GW2011_GWE2_40_11 TaxID=1619033 RepID=A0A0G0QKW0_9BACT|nr:MAG: hypothetical protein UT69_C0005G0018 [Candidatus Yanofskybacteria bacterium GW2011_GWE1_40_10]KKR40743.1 MAG: hypothetical protein UT75_C0005G0051 [Candidatus Yanofskybacteria bacterium GW2011_GWE2_40_11]KKT14836.1 MAG: hypothetical protein UV97_C0015G0008 [Candidatus Yanofskybacteria bacterium GW2011_GWF2_43_596]KKT52742.1 MAG: hypothetical protein UW46_C0012G0014 [Candidatus Yanofskybacteria bacterium GW2011_GWF1_44_227]OGN36026.1 MAG: hypothetical protein A2207_03135 [Candidatus Yano
MIPAHNHQRYRQPKASLPTITMSKILFFFHRCVRGIANRVLDKSLVNARHFSNEMLREYAPVLDGSVINVSGWDDRDKEGGYYREYLTRKLSYAVPNAPSKQKGFGSMVDSGVEELGLDLMLPLRNELVGGDSMLFSTILLSNMYLISRQLLRIYAS